MTSHYGPGMDKGSTSWVRRQSEICRLATLCPWPFEPKVNRLWHSVEDYYCAKFQVIPIRGFRFIVLTYKPTHIHHDKVITVSLPPYQVVGADKNCALTNKF